MDFIVLIIVTSLLYLNASYGKQYVIRRPAHKRNDPSENFLLGESIGSMTTLSGEDCALSCYNNPVCTSSIIMGQQCLMFGERQCHPQQTITTTATYMTTTKVCK